MNLALRDIRKNLGRFLLTTIGIGMLLMIVMGMAGIYRGLVEDATFLVSKIGADLWIVQHDTRGPFAELSRVQSNLVHRARVVPGVKSVREFVYHTIQREHHKESIRISILGLDWPEDNGKWLPIIAGRPLHQNHYEIIVDRSLGLALHDTLRLGKETFTIVGMTSGMIGSGGDGMAFTTISDALSIQMDSPPEAIRLERAARANRAKENDLILQQPQLSERIDLPASQIPVIAAPAISAVIVSIEPHVDLETVKQLFEGWPDVSVYTTAGQEELLVQGIVDKARRQLFMFRVLLTIIAAIIMALILYTLTLDKIHAIAMLKLIGAPNFVILGLIMQQALLLGGLGFTVAYAAGSQLFPLFPRRVIVTQEDLIQLAVVVIAISVLSSLLGIWKAVKIEPNEVLMG